MKRKTVFKIIVAVPAVVAVLVILFIGWFAFYFLLPDMGLEFGYYGQFNRVKHVIEDMPGTVIIDHWQHQDVTLEDFGFSVRLSDGRVVKIDFQENSPQMKERSKSRLRDFIQDQIYATGANDTETEEANDHPEA